MENQSLNKKEFLVNLLNSFSVSTNASTFDITVKYDGDPLVTVNLKSLALLSNALFEFRSASKNSKAIGDSDDFDFKSRVKQVGNLYLSMYGKVVPMGRKTFNKLKAEEVSKLGDVVTIVTQFAEKYPNLGITASRYLQIQFAFFEVNFEKAPKISHLTTDNAVLRAKQLFDSIETWPSKEQLSKMMVAEWLDKSKNKKSSVATTREVEPKKDIRLLGKPLWITIEERETPVADNMKVKSIRRKIREKTATIHEVQYVIDCYEARNATDSIPSEVTDYHEELNKLLRSNYGR